ncbi:MAG TPA: glycoside hydrolase family 76 protein, partial [Chthonomonadales bacterium]|nr:glycoside hydrolase family 76 protein [Chthonomonadales bacterium]
GIFWRESDRASKNTCSNAPAAAAALRLYLFTGKQSYLETGLALARWTTSHLQDTDGLFWDSIRLNGEVEKTKWSYNSALMIRVNCLQYEATGSGAFLSEAKRIATASIQRWIDPQTGGVRDGAAFAHLLLQAMLSLYRQDHDEHLEQVVYRALDYLHASLRDANGLYSENWDTPLSGAPPEVSLLGQASAARAFLIAASGGNLEVHRKHGSGNRPDSSLHDRGVLGMAHVPVKRLSICQSRRQPVRVLSAPVRKVSAAG